MADVLGRGDERLGSLPNRRAAGRSDEDDNDGDYDEDGVRHCQHYLSSMIRARRGKRHDGQLKGLKVYVWVILRIRVCTRSQRESKNLHFGQLGLEVAEKLLGVGCIPMAPRQLSWSLNGATEAFPYHVASLLEGHAGIRPLEVRWGTFGSPRPRHQHQLMLEPAQS